MFAGKPIISYSIEAALSSHLFEEVMVSTDDLEIAALAKKMGAKVPFMRSSENANDYATTASVLQEVLRAYASQGRSFDYALCIYPTAPFVSAAKLQEAFRLLQEHQFDSVFTVVPFSYPVQRALQVSHQGLVSMVYPEYMQARSQDLEKRFHDAGQFYFFKVEPFLRSGKLWTDNTGVLELNEMEVQDIDQETDWEIAELKFKWLQSKSNQ
jgi:N-acylneuraminate cytidylyltransferase